MPKPKTKAKPLATEETMPHEAKPGLRSFVNPSTAKQIAPSYSGSVTLIPNCKLCLCEDSYSVLYIRLLTKERDLALTAELTRKEVKDLRKTLTNWLKDIKK